MSNKKFKASVKVMRSHDYCHFEATLGSDEPMDLDEIDDMRKHAAILVDEAIRQYKIAKAKEQKRSAKEWDLERVRERLDRIEKTPKSELAAVDAAFLRASKDKEFWKEYDDDGYSYSDPERDHHFSMLRKFKEARVRAS